MRNKIYILLFLIVFTSCKKEDELQNSFDSESISYNDVFMHTGLYYDSLVCIYSEYTYIRLTAGPYSEKKEYLWFPSNDTVNVITVNKAGKYSLRVINHKNTPADTSFFSITLLEGSEYELYIPNAFTPDGDGVNDTWQVLGGKVEKYNAKIYNKENQVVFNSYNIQQGWRGDVNHAGEIQPNNSVFRYVVKVKFFNNDNVKAYKGYIRLLR